MIGEQKQYMYPVPGIGLVNGGTVTVLKVTAKMALVRREAEHCKGKEIRVKLTNLR